MRLLVYGWRSIPNLPTAGFDNKWSKNFDKRPHRMSCRYWALNDLFYCVHRSRYSQCFSTGRTIDPPKLHALPVGGSRTPYNTWFFWPTWVNPKQISIRSAVFLHSKLSSLWPTHRHTMTTLRATSAATGRTCVRAIRLNNSNNNNNNNN